MSVQDIQDQFDEWFPHGAILAWGGVNDALSFVSPWVWARGGTLTKPDIEVTGGPEGLLYRFQVTRWEVTQADPFVLTIHPAHALYPYRLGARVPESLWSTPAFAVQRDAAQARAKLIVDAETANKELSA